MFSTVRAKVGASCNDVTIQRAPGCNSTTRLAAVGHSARSHEAQNLISSTRAAGTNWRGLAVLIQHANASAPLHLRASTLAGRI